MPALDATRHTGRCRPKRCRRRVCRKSSPGSAFRHFFLQRPRHDMAGR
ncbi:MAG TPA: hypothetical protein ENN40_04645 [Candidatus Aminicenantes bacterium]|nr:hypothetical protein [Candidatus Aminicenantes bacterium]